MKSYNSEGKVTKSRDRQALFLNYNFDKTAVKQSDPSLVCWQSRPLNDRQKTKKKNKNWIEKIVLMVSGAIIGLLNGFFGGGGGMVCVPILEKVLKLDNKHAHATAIIVILPISLISAFIYVYNGYLQSMPLLIVGAGVLGGGILGSYALKILPPKAIRVIFALVMFAGGIRLIF